MSIYGTAEVKPTTELDTRLDINGFLKRIYEKTVNRESEVQEFLELLDAKREEILQKYKNETGADYTVVVEGISKGACYLSEYMTLTKITTENLIYLAQSSYNIIEAWHKCNEGV